MFDGSARNIKIHLKEIGNDGGAEIFWIKVGTNGRLL
jgi:hypothetical protein